MTDKYDHLTEAERELLKRLQEAAAECYGSESTFPFADPDLYNEATDLLAEVDRLRGALAMGLQLADSGNHDGRNEACPTCHWANVARAALAPKPAAKEE